MDEYADIEDEAKNVIGKVDRVSMRVLAPNQRVDDALAAGEQIYMRRSKGIRTPLSVIDPKKRRR